MLFLHERQTPAGDSRLVAVQLYCKTEPRRDRTLLATVFSPAARGLPARRVATASIALHLPAESDESLSLFAGQPDAHNPSRFSIPLQVGSRAHLIEGWLTEDSIVLRPRVAELISWNTQPSWRLTGE